MFLALMNLVNCLAMPTMPTMAFLYKAYTLWILFIGYKVKAMTQNTVSTNKTKKYDIEHFLWIMTL